MAAGDVLEEAAAELYSADPEEFVQRRVEWIARARAAGQAATARKINALRKPTRSAWVVNRLAWTEPDAADQLDALGKKLRAAERARDGARLRDLSRERRELIASLVRRALAGADQAAAPAAMREEVTATFAAALADPDIAGQLRQGRLVRPARRPGFGTLQEPVLMLVPPLDQPQPAAAQPAAAQAEAALAEEEEGESEDEAAAQARAEAEAAAAARAEEEARARAEAEAAARAEAQRVRATAERALAQAEAALETAGKARQEREDAVRRLEEELNEARRLLHEARAKVRQTETEYRKARQALGRLPGWS